MNVKVEIKGLDELAKKLNDLGANRIPNYLARAVNDAAREAQAAMAKEVQDNLTVRGTWLRPGTRFGINLTPATKDNLTATVSSRAPWLIEQETQTERTAQGSRLILPLIGVRAGGRTDPKKIPARLKPKAMGEKLFPIMTKRGPVLFQRLKRAGLRAMWALERIVRYPRRVHVVDAGVKAANDAASKAVANQIDAAIREQGLK